MKKHLELLNDSSFLPMQGVSTPECLIGFKRFATSRRGALSESLTTGGVLAAKTAFGKQIITSVHIENALKVIPAPLEIQEGRLQVSSQAKTAKNTV